MANTLGAVCSGKIAYKVALAYPQDIERGIQMAVEAFPKMAALSSWQRKEILEHCVKEFKARFDDLANALCIEAGKPIKDSRGEVGRLIDTFTIAAEESTRIYGEWAPMDIAKRTDGFMSIVRGFPIGPISMISPFNFPLNLAAHKIAPALAVGCPFVVKPASRTPIGALIIGEYLPCILTSHTLFISVQRFCPDDRIQIGRRHRLMHLRDCASLASAFFTPYDALFALRTTILNT